jgi:hypothetical protein
VLDVQDDVQVELPVRSCALASRRRFSTVVQTRRVAVSTCDFAGQNLDILVSHLKAPRRAIVYVLMGVNIRPFCYFLKARGDCEVLFSLTSGMSRAMATWPGQYEQVSDPPHWRQIQL